MILAIIQGHKLFHIKFLVNGAWYDNSHYRLIGKHTPAFDWCHFWYAERHFWRSFQSIGCYFHVRYLRKYTMYVHSWWIGAWLQRGTNRKRGMGSRMVTWPMTSRDLERSRSWPNYLQGPISPKWLEIWAWSQRGTNRKRGMGSRMVTWPMTSRDLERSRSWPNYL